MTKKTTLVFMMLLVLASSLAASTPLYNVGINGQLRQAESTHTITVSGRVVTSLNTGVANAKVYLEAPYNGVSTPKQLTFTADGFGLFTATVPSGYSYTPDASKYGSSRARYPSPITTSTSDITLISNPQTTAVLDLFIAPDDEFRSAHPSDWQSVAWSKIKGKEWLVLFNNRQMTD